MKVNTHDRTNFKFLAPVKVTDVVLFKGNLTVEKGRKKEEKLA